MRRVRSVVSTATSATMFSRAKVHHLGGVGSDERGAVDPYPILAASGHGSKLIDVDGNEYIDWQMGFGALILGHCPEPVVEAVIAQVRRGSLFGTPHELEVQLAERISSLVPSIETMRFV